MLGLSGVLSVPSHRSDVGREETRHSRGLMSLGGVDLARLAVYPFVIATVQHPALR